MASQEHDFAAFERTARALDKKAPEPVDPQRLIDTANALVAPGKGILAADESNGTGDSRLKAIDAPTGPDGRRAYREMLLAAPGLSEFISGTILYDETIRQETSDGTPFPQLLDEVDIITGIKVDTGTVPLAGHPGEQITQGLDGLRDRLGEYVSVGARFAKWRAVISIGDGLPSEACVRANGHAMARYAALCQESGVVPIVEPEVLLDGSHDIDACEQATTRTLRVLFEELVGQDVLLEGVLLKASMVLPGKDNRRAAPEEVAEATVRTLLRAVPAAIPGIVFLSGGQDNLEATENLNAINAEAAGTAPWALTFSYARALQGPALDVWGGKEANLDGAHEALVHRARCNSAAATGGYKPEMEDELAA